MLVRNDYICTGCDRLMEFYGGPDYLCECGGEWELVFTEPPRFRVDRASVVNHVCDHNAKRMSEIYEEDAEPGSDFDQIKKELEYEVDNGAIDSI